MGRSLILRGVERRLIKRIREHAAPLELTAGVWARALLFEQLGKRLTQVGKLKRRKPSQT